MKNQLRCWMEEIWDVNFCIPYICVHHPLKLKAVIGKVLFLAPDSDLCVGVFVSYCNGYTVNFLCIL